jgi:hydrogenase expression/formation protein HypC
MCLAIPMQLTEISGDRGVAEAGGVRREVGLQLLDGLKIGDYVLVHAGFAIQKVDEEEARKTLDLFRELGQVF